MNNINTIILATGGTAGHINPAVALSEALLKLNVTTVIIADERYINYHFNDSQRYHIIASASLGGNKILALCKIAYGLTQALKLLLKIRPQMVVGFGGYPSFPTLLAAKLLRIPIVLHEQNAVLGKVNKFFLANAKKVALSFPDTKKVPTAYQHKIAVVGNPVRNSFAEHNSTYPELKPGEKLTILVVGGSQGAAIFGAILPKAIASLPKELRSRLFILQQCRKQEVDLIKSFYDKAEVEALVQSFFVNMATQFNKAHLVISRAGASTLAEIALIGRPAILVPYPHSIDDHQLHNAQAFTKQYGGWCIQQEEFSVEYCIQQLTHFLVHPELLTEAAQKMQKENNDAATELAELIMR